MYVHSLCKSAAVTALITVASTALAQEVTFQTDTSDDALTAALEGASLTLAIERDSDAAAQDFVAAARADYRRVLTALYAAGYFGGTISISVNGIEAAAIAPLDAPPRIDRIVIDVQTGPLFTFGRAQIAPATSATRLPDSFASGQPASTQAIKDAVRTAVDAWRNEGHAKAVPTGQKITARHAENMLDATVTLDPGPRLTFGTVSVAGNVDVRTNRIIRIAGIPQSESFSPDDIEAAARRLRRTGAFDSVAIQEAEAIGPNQTLPVTVTVAESKPRRFGFGIELSSIEGLRVSSYWMHRNFFGGAERLRVEGEISGIGSMTGGTDYAIRASLDRPAIWSPDTDLFIRAEILRLDEPDYLIDKASLEIGASQIVTDDLTIEAGVGLLTAREVTPAFTRTYQLFTLPLEATLDKRNDMANATNGYYLNTSATPFISFDGDTLGGRIYADARAYRSFGLEDKVTFAGRLQIGSVFGVEANEAPADYLFRSGGGGTVRGQPYQSLGFDQTSGSNTYRTGGLAFAGAQLEARYAVTDLISAVGFYDIGLISAQSDFGGDTDWHSGLGLGVRYNTGIGPIRLDVGTPANGEDAFGSAQVYIGIGQSF